MNQRNTKTNTDPVQTSYRMKELNEEKEENEKKQRECNSISTDIRKEYDSHVFENEICFYELFDKLLQKPIRTTAIESKPSSKIG